MIVNNKLGNLKDNYFFKKLCVNLNLECVFENGTLFIFNDRYSFICSDLINDDHIDFLLFDRKEKTTISSSQIVREILQESMVSSDLTFSSEIIKESIMKSDLGIYDEKKFNYLVRFIDVLSSFGRHIFYVGIPQENFHTKPTASVSGLWLACMS